jgi:hypothetical protein
VSIASVDLPYRPLFQREVTQFSAIPNFKLTAKTGFFGRGILPTVDQTKKPPWIIQDGFS